MKALDFYSKHAIFEIPINRKAKMKSASNIVMGKFRLAVSEKNKDDAECTASRGKINIVMMKVSLKMSLAACEATKVD